MFITGFPAGMLACNCYVLAERPGADAIVVGRPIRLAADPRAAALAIQAEIAGALNP